MDKEEKKALNHLNSHLNLVTVPDPYRKIYKSKCFEGSDTPRSEHGLFIEMLSLIPYGYEYLQKLCKGHETTIFLNIKHTKKSSLLKDSKGAEELPDGYVQTCSVVAMPQNYTIPYPAGSMPEKVRLAVMAILAATDCDSPQKSIDVDMSTGKEVHSPSDTAIKTDTALINVSEPPSKRHKTYEHVDYMKSPHTESVIPEGSARVLLDALDNIRRLDVKNVEIPLPTIVVVGDQSSGKSSLLTSLSGICLPSGGSMVTRVPLIIRLHHSEKSEIVLEFKKKSITLMTEYDIPEAIQKATSEITGDSSSVSGYPITLVVKKYGISDLTLIDLPGLIRVAAPNQPQDICERIRGIVLEYTQPKEAIILNVINANQDLATTSSLEMCQSVDPTGQRTLTVLTKCDSVGSHLFVDMLTTNKLNIGLGFMCVRNRIGEESIEEAERAEKLLFSTDKVLSKIDKTMVGIPLLSKKLVKIQMDIMRKLLPQVVAKIDDIVGTLHLESSRLPMKLNSELEAVDAFMRLTASLRSAIHEFSGRVNIKMTKKARVLSNSAKLYNLLNVLKDDLLNSDSKTSGSFLKDEIEFVLANTKVCLPGGFSQELFELLLEERVETTRKLPLKCAADALAYFEEGCIKVVSERCSNYPHVLPVAEKAVKMCMEKIRHKIFKRTEEITTMQKFDFTIDPGFRNSYEKVRSENREILLRTIGSRMRMANLHLFGKVDVYHLHDSPVLVRDHAFDLKLRLEVYWNIVVTRIVDSLGQRMRMMLDNAETKIEHLMTKNVLGEAGRVSKMMAEPEELSKRREYLLETISVLKDSRNVLVKFFS